MKKYLVTNKKTQEICGKFDSKNEAAEQMMDFINEYEYENDETYFYIRTFTFE